VSQGARPELEHAMLFFRYFRRNGPLCFHFCQFQDLPTLLSTMRLTDNVDMPRM
jgi:hypothetical protein